MFNLFVENITSIKNSMAYQIICPAMLIKLLRVTNIYFLLTQIIIHYYHYYSYYSLYNTQYIHTTTLLIAQNLNS